jgi:hypothetical protein
VNSFEPAAPASGSDVTLHQSRASAVRVGDIVYAGWQFEDDTDAGSIDRVFVATAELDATSPGGLRLRDELLLPPAPVAVGAGKIGNMRLAASPLFPSGALISAWEQTTATHATTLVLDLRPSPFVFLNGGGPG